MEIQQGTQPNCSELVVRLWSTNRDDVEHMLGEMGVQTCIINDKYGSGKKMEKPEWDGDDKIDLGKLIMKNLPEEIKKAWIKHRMDYDDESEKVLKDFGIDPTRSSEELLEFNANFDPNFSSFWISTYPYSEDGELAIWYHQHCQTQGFPLLSKMASHFNSDVEAHDGGSMDAYNSWQYGDDQNEEEDDE